jgi:hypothetical protein
MSLARSIRFRAWADPDGAHVWTSHDCVTGREIIMLPNDQWRIAPHGFTFSPSFHCLKCGCHTTSETALEEPPDDWCHAIGKKS